MAGYTTLTIGKSTVSIYESPEYGFYISLTDILKNILTDEKPTILDWFRDSQNFLTIHSWEEVYNPHYAPQESSKFLGKSSNILIEHWVNKTNAIGLFTKKDPQNAVYAHQHLTIEFLLWCTPMLRVFLLEKITDPSSYIVVSNIISWLLDSLNEKNATTTDNIFPTQYTIPVMDRLKNNDWLKTASEIDLVQVALLGFTQEMWETTNPDLLQGGRTFEDILRPSDQTVLNNLKRLNDTLKRFEISKMIRFKVISEEAQAQRLPFAYLQRSGNNETGRDDSHLSNFNQNLMKALGFDSDN